MVKEGIALYSIEADGCLNGVYTNEHRTTGGVICNEIARIKDRSKVKDDCSGLYDCFYFEEKGRLEGELEITVKNRVYTFEWRDSSGTPIFRGQGYKMNGRQIAIHYISV